MNRRRSLLETMKFINERVVRVLLMHLPFPLRNYPLALAGLGIWSHIYVKKPQLSERSEFCGFSKYCYSLPSAAAVSSLVDYRRHSSRLFSYVKNQVKPRSLLLSSDGKEGRRQAIQQAYLIYFCLNSSRNITDNRLDNLRH